MLAARFLAKFIEGDILWLHVNRKGGLGAVASDVNGFGVGFGMQMLKRWHENLQTGEYLRATKGV